MILTTGLILFIVFSVFMLIQIGYYLFLFTGVFKPLVEPKSTTESVSVIICVRNNLAGLKENLPHILGQDYPNFEIIVVNDGSTDGTIDYLDSLESSNNRIRVIHLDIDERFHRGKKFAQTIGIKAAKNNLLLFTDSDCKPVSNQWIKNMAASYLPQTQIVLGISNYKRTPGLLNWIMQLESFHTALLYTNAALRGRGYMGVGRNLSYQRDLFFKVKGFASHQHVLSGDDDLFVNETATAKNVAVCLNPEAITQSLFKGGFGKWLHQKKRHFSTGKYYRTQDKILLGGYHFSLFFIYASLPFLILDPNWWMPALIAFAIRFIVQAIILFKNTKVLNYEPYYWVFPFMDIGILLIQIFVGIRGYFSKPKRW